MSSSMKYSLIDPGHGQLKREGITDQSTRRMKKDNIEKFFKGEYNDIVESQLEANNNDDFQTDKILTDYMMVNSTACLYSANYIQ